MDFVVLAGQSFNHLHFINIKYGHMNSNLKLMMLFVYTLRMDGFTSIYAPMKGGEMITRPFVFKGSTLILNFSSSVAGEILVDILDENGNPIPNFTFKDCDPVFGDSIERKVSWKGIQDVSNLVGKTIQLRFRLKDADLYSFQFK